MRVPADGPDRQLVDDYLLREQISDAVRFAPHDDDDLNAALCEGRFSRVIFANFDELLGPLWKGHASVDRWREAGVRIELVIPPWPSPDASQASRRPPAPADTDITGSIVTAIHASLQRWRRQQRRRQIIASAVLSLLALAAMAALLLSLPRP